MIKPPAEKQVLSGGLKKLLGWWWIITPTKSNLRLNHRPTSNYIHSA